eukprot:GHVR01096708.1.p1 GENE.GHVR01096708.1~~GHVR01096708.1.p1  ORF type:complete len:369 (+),score=82.18 GHVR01096708.1:103-1209(+)
MQLAYGASGDLYDKTLGLLVSPRQSDESFTLDNVSTELIKFNFQITNYEMPTVELFSLFVNNSDKGQIKSEYKTNLGKLNASTLDVTEKEYSKKVDEIISTHTHELITHIDVAGSDGVLFNTIYFKGIFEYKFKPATDSNIFYDQNNNEINAEMMERTHTYPVVEKDEYTIVCIPYKTNKKEPENNKTNTTNNDNNDDDDKNNFTLAALLPNSSQIDGENGLLSLYKTVKDINCDTDSNNEIVRITFPKTDLTSQLDLHEFFAHAGLGGYYKEGSLNRIRNSAYVGKAIQELVVKFDYESTEAAAVTYATTLAGCAFDCEPKKIDFNRPFIFSINTAKNNNTKKSEALFKGLVFSVDTNKNEDNVVDQ